MSRTDEFTCVTGYWYPNRSTEMIRPHKPIQSPRMLAQDILDELNEVHPFRKDPFLIGKIKNYMHTKKYNESYPTNQMSGLFYRKSKKTTPKNILLQPDIFKLGEEELKFSSRDIKALTRPGTDPSQECFVFGEQAIINSVSAKLQEQKYVQQEIRCLDNVALVKKPSPHVKKEKHKRKEKQQITESKLATNSKLHKSGIDGSWTVENDNKKTRERCCPRQLSKIEEDPNIKVCSSLKPQKLLGLGEKSDEYSYPICPRGTAAIILKTYSTYNIKWQFRAKYVTLGVQKKRKRKRKWRARQWAWFMQRRGKKIERRHQRKLQRKQSKSSQGSAKTMSEVSVTANKRRRSSKVMSKYERMKTKVIYL